jgi:hypothetical protein
MSGNGQAQHLTPRQLRSLETLLVSGDVSAAAAAARVSRKTIYGWIQEDAYRTALAEAETAALGAVGFALMRLAETAASTLRAAMEDDDAPLAARVRAAATVFQTLVRIREMTVVEARLAKLEQQMEESNGYFRAP